jgi:hypothetical protein
MSDNPALHVVEELSKRRSYVVLCMYLRQFILIYNHHHRQPINVPTTGAQTFLMDNPQGEQAITHPGYSRD